MHRIRFLPTPRPVSRRRAPDWRVWGPALGTSTLVPAIGYQLNRVLLPATDHTWIYTSLHLIEALVIAAVCFFVVHAKPRRAWYAPLVCNLRTLLCAWTDPLPWPADRWWVVAGGWMLSLVATAAARALPPAVAGRHDPPRKMTVL